MNKVRLQWGWLDAIIFLLGILPVLGAIVLYDRLPETLAVHFGVSGEANGFQDKFSFLVLYGALIIGLPLLMKVFRQIDPKRENYEKFHGFYEMLRLLLTLILAGLLGGILLFNLGYSINFQLITLLIIGGLWIFMGNYMTRIRFTYFMGIRTPWTLANEEVWRRTHRLAGPLWMISGLLVVLAAFMPGILAVWIFGIAVGTSVILPIVYSYVMFQKLSR